MSDLNQLNVHAPTAAVSVQSEAADEDGLVEDELIVEEISIDGMCGVY